MENKPENKINDAEIILLGDDLILNSGGIHDSLTDKINEISLDLIPAIQKLYYKPSEVYIPVNEVRRAKVGVIKEDEILTPALSLDGLLKTEFPQARWVVEQLFESGTINMISAPPNKWKSWVVILCALCIASGKDLFGKFKTQKQGVLIVNEEDSERLLQERCQMLIEDDEELDVYFHVGKQIKLEEDFVDYLVKEAKEKNIGLIIFDSLRSVHSADENSSKEMQEIMDQLKRITSEGLTVLFTHHNRKKSRDGKGGNSGEDSRGSSAINASIHGHLSLEEVVKEDSRYLIVYQQKLKADKKMEPIKILVNQDKESNKFSFVYEGPYKNEEMAFNKTQDSLIRLFEDSNDGYTVKDLNEINMGGIGTVRTVLKLLISKKIIYCKVRINLSNEELSLLKTRNGKSNEKVYFKKTNELDNF